MLSPRAFLRELDSNLEPCGDEASVTSLCHPRWLPVRLIIFTFVKVLYVASGVAQ
jgi:hypothetical protein